MTFHWLGYLLTACSLACSIGLALYVPSGLLASVVMAFMAGMVCCAAITTHIEVRKKRRMEGR